MKKIILSDNEKAVLNGMRSIDDVDLFCFYCNYRDTCEEATQISEEYLCMLEGVLRLDIPSEKFYSGIISSLIKKDLVFTEQVPHEVDYFISFTEKAKEIFTEKEGEAPTEKCRIPFIE